MDDNSNTDVSGCCDGGQCCPPGQGRGRQFSNRWKTLVFIVVILSACGVGAYSLFWRSDNAASTSCCPPGSPEAAACGQVTANPGFDHEAAPVGLSVTALFSSEASLSNEQLNAIGNLRAAVESHGEQLLFESLQPTDSVYRKLVEQYQVVSFPAFVITGQEGVLVLNGDQLDIDTVKVVFKTATATNCASPASEKKTL